MAEQNSTNLQPKYLALEFGGTHICCAAVQGRCVLESTILDSKPGVLMVEVLEQLSAHLHGFLRQHGPGFVGLGMGFCGLVNHRERRIASTNRKYEDGADVDLVRWAEQEFCLPFRLENDARLALLGEHYCGAAEGSDDVVLMTIGTGIGTAVMTEGHVLRGKHSQAGILGGHLKIPGSLWKCSCGGAGCYEAQASTFALPSICAAWPGIESSALKALDDVNFQRVFQIADEGDKAAQEVRSFCLETWKACALSMVHAYDPDCLVVGGGVLNSNFPIIQAIQKELQSQAWTPWGEVRVVATQHGRNAALLGVTPLFEEIR